jgi:5-methylcytosine-specific restriction endonuclease McrA
MPTATAIRRYWASWLVEQGKFDNIEEVTETYINDDDEDEGYCCFACGFTSTQTLYRAHIQAIAEGGSNDASNLHMLCLQCHEASEYLSGDDYFKWFANRTIMHRVIEASMRTPSGSALVSQLLSLTVGAK